jgi:hypothetical protein
LRDFGSGWGGGIPRGQPIPHGCQWPIRWILPGRGSGIETIPALIRSKIDCRELLALASIMVDSGFNRIEDFSCNFIRIVLANSMNFLALGVINGSVALNTLIIPGNRGSFHPFSPLPSFIYFLLHFSLILQCCTFEGLRFSQEVGSTTIGPGEAITGGEVVRGGRQISFDVIANVKKVVKQENNSGNKITYEVQGEMLIISIIPFPLCAQVTVRRMNCLPDPPEPEIECSAGGYFLNECIPIFLVDSNVPAEVAKVLSNAKNKELTDKFKDPAKKPQPNKKQRAEKQKHKLAIKQQLDELYSQFSPP